MNVFLTGGSGLVGSHAIERLTALGHRVTALVRSAEGAALVEPLGAMAVRGAVEDPAAWRLAGDAEAIVHAAALVTAVAGWPEYRRVNVGGTRLAVETATRTGARLIHLSSVAVYGRGATLGRDGPVSEDGPYGPIPETDYYALSKRESEDVLWAASAESPTASATPDAANVAPARPIALRPCVIYGERDRQFMPRVLRALRLGVAPVIGHGENRLAVVYAGNVVEAVVAALAHPRVSGPFNVTNDGGITQREFYELVGAAMGRRLLPLHVPEPLALAAVRAVSTAWAIARPSKYGWGRVTSGRFLSRDNPFTSARAQRELEWRPATPPQDAVVRTVRWFEERTVP